MSHQAVMIEGLDGDWGGDPDHKARMRVTRCAGDGDAVLIEVATEGWEDELAKRASILVKWDQAPRVCTAVQEEAAATRDAWTIEGLGNDGTPREIIVESPEGNGIAWLWMCATDSEGEECRFGLGFDRARAAQVRGALRSLLEIGAAGTAYDEEKTIEATSASCHIEVTGGWLRVALSFEQSRRIGVTVKLVTANGNVLSVGAWLRFADAQRLISDLAVAVPVDDSRG